MKMKRIYIFCFFILFASFVFCQEKDKPRNGERITTFLLRHNRTGTKQYEEFIRLNKHKLGKSNTLLRGVYYVLPPLSTTNQSKKTSPVKTKNQETSVNPDTILDAEFIADLEPDSILDADINSTPIKRQEERIENIKDNVTTKSSKKRGVQPLFGEKYKNYEIIDHVLTGACFFLVSGHGGPDPGAIAKVDGHSLHEDEYAYDIILRLARNLLQHGATVHIIIQDSKDGIRDGKYLNNSKQETCMGKTIPLSQVARLKQESDEINRLSYKAKEKYQRAIFIHLDSRSKKKQLDVFFYYQDSKENKHRSLQLANTMQQTFRSLYNKHQPDRGFSGTVSTRPLYVMRNTTPVSIFVELANMQNVNDQRRYVLDNNRQALANWLCTGFIKNYQSSSR
jgi:N-acetylmuramoyl-L-alanine amidase